MLLRNNALEWDPKTKGPYNWVKNKDRLKDYWRGAVEQWGQYDNLYTIGMRGADDFPMEGADSAEKMGDILRDVVTEQRNILTETLHKPADQIPQVFTPYKEVAAAYNTGRIDLPKDVTIIWPDDNYGYMLQLDDAKERQRPGGSGVYYHATFWGAPGNYLMLGSTDPNLMWEELRRAYHADARTVWMLNVGNIKPCEYLVDFFLAMAFDMDAFATPGSTQRYMRDWAAQTFGAEHGAQIADIMWRYYKLAFDRNPEFTGFTTTFPETPVQQGRFAITDFGDENARRADAYRSIMTQSKGLLASLPDDRKSAFFELVDYTINTGGNMSLQQLDLDKSLAYGLQRRASANRYAEDAQQAHQAIVDNVRRYNQATEGGKWNGIVTDYPQFLPNYLPPAIPHWTMPTDERRCGVQLVVSDAAGLPSRVARPSLFSRYLHRTAGRRALERHAGRAMDHARQASRCLFRRNGLRAAAFRLGRLVQGAARWRRRADPRPMLRRSEADRRPCPACAAGRGYGGLIRRCARRRIDLRRACRSAQRALDCLGRRRP